MQNSAVKKSIMVVDDDADVRAALSHILIKDGYTVVEAKDGRLAEAMLERQWPDAILSDCRMPNLDGVGLLERVRKVSNVPFILMTGFSEILETEEAQKLGATDFILKPFKREELLASLAIAISSRPALHEKVVPLHDNENQDLDFCRLSIDEFVAGKVSLADIFVRLTEKKYVQVARGGSELSLDRIQAYKSKGLHFLYIRKVDFAKYVGLNLDLTKAVSQKSRISKPQRLRLLKHTSEVMLQDCFINGVEKEKLEASGALVEALVSTLSEDAEIFDLLTLLQTHADHLYAHSLGVSLYSVMVAKHLGWTSAPTLFKVAMGGLLHDIGKKEISREILEKPRSSFTRPEREIYETHPIRGKEILSVIRSVPDDVVQISMHHHENNVGRGFPYRLMKTKIHPLARLIAVVNEFANLTVKSSTGETPVTAGEALTRLYNLKGQELDLGFLRSLMEIFNHPVPDGMPKSVAV
jgi:putative nucleotidyltransferase with HDIG domain